MFLISAHLILMLMLSQLNLIVNQDYSLKKYFNFAFSFYDVNIKYLSIITGQKTVFKKMYTGRLNYEIRYEN